MLLNFVPTAKVVNPEFSFGKPSDEQIADEQMIYSGNWDYTYSNGGDLTRMIMDRLSSTVVDPTDIPAGKHIVIDTRSNMLMPGQFPSIPGWHCDDVPRGVKYAQPDLNLCDDITKHYMVLLSSTKGISRTEFVYKEFQCEIDPNNVWGSLDTQVELLKPKTMFVPEGKVVQFGQQDIHRASKCVEYGWRFFFRCSITHRQPVNKIRRQVQVYTTVNGW